jgi:predicted N-acetyltransferase YhbS
MEYSIKQVTTERELDDTLAFYKKVFEVTSECYNPAYSREKLLKQINSSYNNLLLYAESDNEVIGIVFGRVENGTGIIVGPVAVDERFRKHGIARELMLLLEKHSLVHGIHRLTLGAVESAEGFYQKLAYTGTLLIQSDKHSIDEILALNCKYQVINTNVYDGIVNQVYLNLPVPDREFQRKCENTLQGCNTQMIFGKTI